MNGTWKNVTFVNDSIDEGIVPININIVSNTNYFYKLFMILHLIWNTIKNINEYIIPLILFIPTLKYKTLDSDPIVDGIVPIINIWCKFMYM